MRKGLIIGVQRYREGWSPAIAPAVAHDTDEVGSLLRSLGFSLPSMPLGAGGEEVASDDIRNAIIDLLDTAAEDDEIVVYFSGHGRQQDGTLYLVHSKAPSTHPLSALVPLRFDEAVATTRARSATFLIDACRTGDDLPFAKPADNENGRVVSFVLASKPGKAAHTADGASVFTRSLVKVVRELSTETPLITAVDEIQRAMTHLTRRSGIEEQRIDVVTNLLDAHTAPFPLFGAGPAAGAAHRWTDLIRESAALTAALPTASLADLFAVFDKVEREAPRLVAPGPAITPLAQPGLADRLMRALEKVLPRIPTDLERTLLLGLTVAVEAGLRRAEASLLSTKAPLQTDVGPWGAHRLALQQLFAGQRMSLAADMMAIVAAACPPGTSLDRRALIRNSLCDSAQAVFDESAAQHELPRRVEVDVEKGTAVAPRRLSSALELVWWLSLDTRLFPRQFELAVQHDDEDVAELVARLDAARWWERDNALDLDARIAYAPLDYALRRMTEEVSARLFRDAQVDAPLHGLGLPVVATAGRVVPEAQAYTLPHFTFKISTAELARLLMGTELYGDESLALREVYQNAVDACRYREQRELSYEEAEPDYRPHVRVEESEHNGRRAVDFIDNGVGMSDYELREAFARVGKRFRDLPEFIEEQSQWQDQGRVGFYPISQFGIGVLSYFMVAERVELWTVRKTGPHEFATARHVDILAGADLFRVRTTTSGLVPGSGGTRVRLHLRPDVLVEADVLETMKRIIRAPLVRVTHKSSTSATVSEWTPGVLYSSDGTPIWPCHHVPDYGIYLHEGVGEVLVNGIPVDNGGFPAFSHSYRGPQGVTISVDARLAPDLSVDRRTLRGFDVGLARDFLQRAAATAPDWPDVSVNWLVELFQFDAAAGRAAFRALRDSGRPVVLRARPDPLEGEVSVKIRPWDSGFFLQDPSLSPGNLGILGAYRWAELSALLGAGDSVEHSLSHPAFDDRLAVLQSVAEQADPLFVSVATVTADNLGVSLGATVTFAWALAFFESRMLPVWLRSKATQLSRTRAPRDWAALADSTELPVLGGFGYEPLDWLFDRISATDPQFLRDVLDYGLDPDRHPPPPAARYLLSRDLDGRPPYVVGSGSVDWSHVDAAMKTLPSQVDPRPEVDVSAGELQRAAAWLAAEFGRDDDAPAAEPQTRWPPALPTASEFPPGTSEGARLAASVDFDGRTPFFEGTVPAACVSRAARKLSVDPEAIVVELESLGFAVLPGERDWGILQKLYPVLTGIQGGDSFDVSGRLRAPSMSKVEHLVSSSLIPWEELFRSLADGDVMSDQLRRLRDMPMDALSALSTILFQDFDAVDITWLTLTRLADQLTCTYGQAFDRLRPLLEVVRSWHLPEDLPLELATATPPEHLAGLTSYWRGDGLDAADNVLSAIWLALVQEVPMSEVSAVLLPLIELSGVDTETLRRVADEVPWVITFDDVLAVGTQQFRPPVNDVDLGVALCIPFAREESPLRERVDAWIRVGRNLRPSGTDRIFNLH